MSWSLIIKTIQGSAHATLRSTRTTLLLPPKRGNEIKKSNLEQIPSFNSFTHSMLPSQTVFQDLGRQGLWLHSPLPLVFFPIFKAAFIHTLVHTLWKVEIDWWCADIIHKSCLKSKLIYLSTLAEGHRDTNHDFFLFGLLPRRNAATLTYLGLDLNIDLCTS